MNANRQLDRKTITFIVTSDRRGVTRRFVIPVSWIKVTAAIGLLSIALVAATVVDYAGLLFQTVENKKLKAENLQLKNQFKVVEGKVETLEKNFERVNAFTNKLRMITETNDGDKALKLSVSQQNPGGSDAFEAPEERSPAGLLGKEDSIFFQKAPLETQNGELAIATQRDYARLSVRIDKNIKGSELKEQNVLQLLEILSDRQSLLRSTPSIQPARGWLSSGFGYRVNPTTNTAILHQGLDIAASPGTPIHAPADGVISYAGWDEGYGKLISIDHGYGVVTRYGHNSQLFVTVGQKVKRGDVIGAVGNTGRSTGPHLHYEVRINDVPVDPINYILTE